MHLSGAQSASLVQAFWQLPCSAPLHDCAPPQSSLVVQAQVPALHTPLEQSLFFVQAKAWHVPPQRYPEAQSLLPVHVLASQVAPVHVPSGH
jgi:hypothetical protein